MKVEIGGVEFESTCPSKCPGRSEPMSQGGLCFRCPIFNCIPSPNDPEQFVLLRPEEYRKDWAREWKRWFDSGMNGLPKLML